MFSHRHLFWEIFLIYFTKINAYNASIKVHAFTSLSTMVDSSLCGLSKGSLWARSALLFWNHSFSSRKSFHVLCPCVIHVCKFYLFMNRIADLDLGSYLNSWIFVIVGWVFILCLSMLYQCVSGLIDLVLSGYIYTCKIGSAFHISDCKGFQCQ